jgi:hypothetical protein
MSTFLVARAYKGVIQSNHKASSLLDKETKAQRLPKATYGLKLASRAWNSQFHGALIELSFTRKYSGDGIYTYHHKTLSGAISNADDITITGAETFLYYI